ncbi:Ig-like domain-containing protein [Pedobacter sp. N36a]|uniref:Ig-like domain-containing protein n=1 Tax=Pedobacter sp. N36a TaxID=2767996 RepID=UPI001656D2E3|nr:Ig-like domain-containing protein [Pedobacter sp. N36a]MBC8984423.1 Ig-like domain-containing protein [Pedobacter sp. N36a]
MSLFSLKNISRNCFLLLLTITLIVIWGDDVKGQRVYATTSSASANSSSPLKTVSNIANCTSGTGNSTIQPSATPLTRVLAKGTNGGLGVGTATIAYADLKFDAAVPSNTIVFAKITAVSLPTSASTVTGVALNNGVAAAGTAFYNIVAGDGSQYVAVYATAAFNQIRINVTAAGSGLLNVTPEETASVDIQYAYYNANGSSAPVDCGIAIGTSKSGNGAVDNMQQAIDGNLTTYSTITPAALLSSVNQHFYFSALSNTTDEIKVTLSVPAMALSLGLANTITISAYNGSNPTAVWTQTLGTLLSLDLLTLLGSGIPVTTSIKPGASFDRLTVNSAAVLSVLFSLRVHEVQITAASPVLTVPNPTICANTSTTLVVTPPALTTAKWYDAATGGNLVGTGNSFTTPLLTTTTTYYVAIVKNGCTEESIRVPALVTVLPAPDISPILGTLTACVGKTTSLSSLTAGGNWTSGTPTVATIDQITGIVTGQTTGTSIITYTVTGANNCTKSTTAIVTINTLPAVPTISGTLTACVGKTTTLTGNPTGGVWSSATPAVATIDPATGIVTGVTSGTSVITYTVINANGCTSSQTATVTIYALPVVAAITGIMSTCIGKTTQLANTTSPGVWSSANPTIATVNSTGLVTGIAVGTATINYTVTNGNGCITIVTASVTVHLQPALPTITQKNLCLGQAVDLNTLNPNDGNGTTGGTYSWSAISAGGTPLSSTTVSPALGNTTYYLRYTKDGCFSDSSVLIIMHPKPPTPHVILN